MTEFLNKLRNEIHRFEAMSGKRPSNCIVNRKDFYDTVRFFQASGLFLPHNYEENGGQYILIEGVEVEISERLQVNEIELFINLETLIK